MNPNQVQSTSQARIYHGLATIEGTTVPKSEYIYTDLSEVSLEMSRAESNKRREVISLRVAGEEVTYTPRFSTSLSGLLGQSRSVFNLFEPTEVIERAIQRGVRAPMRLTTVTTIDGHRVALAATRPEKPVVDQDEYLDLLIEHGVDLNSVGYSDGEITTVHTPKLPMAFNIGPDLLDNRFVTRLPLDGYGKPTSFIAMVRQVCRNLGIMYHPIFSTKINLGGDDDTSSIGQLDRFFQTFANEEGFAAVADRLRSALRVPASLEEVYQLLSLLYKMDQDEGDDAAAAANSPGLAPDSGVEAHEIRENLKATAAGGDNHIAQAYGITSLDQLHPKRRRILPTKMTVYDLFNFGTELGTHYLNEAGRREVGQLMGKMVSNEFDLEGDDTLHVDETPADLFIKAAERADLDSEAHSLS